jgi:D-beta-D-heptose 7-phosphate kinase/D-beta-D-heptose 1-phosphate adenosyltransferase
MKKGRILVVGDIMLDEFLWGDVARISPEAPVPVVEVRRQSFHLGGAANVAANLSALGGSAVLAGVVGQDDAARRIRELLAAAGAEAQLAPSDGGRPTTVKTRIVAHHQQVVRADWERGDELSQELERGLLELVRRVLPSCRVVIISDYQKGVVTPAVVKAVVSQARRRRIPVLVDPKVRHFRLYRRVTVITPNQLETEQATGLRIGSNADLEAAARSILKDLACEAVLVTRGEQGMSLFSKSSPPTHVATAAREVFDVTGAGDTVIATMGLALGAGAELYEAAALANYAAGVVVGKLGTATASQAELLAAVEAGSH